MESIIDKGQELVVDKNKLAFLERNGYVFKNKDGYYHPTDAVDNINEIETIVIVEGMMV